MLRAGNRVGLNQEATMASMTAQLVTGYVKLWPREVFYIPQHADEVKNCLNHAGVYILYQDFDVFYIGKANRLFVRLRYHANKRYRLWNHFSAFLVHQSHLAEVEAIMIAATPRTDNKSGGKVFDKINLPLKLQNVLDRSHAKFLESEPSGLGGRT